MYVSPRMKATSDGQDQRQNQTLNYNNLTYIVSTLYLQLNQGGWPALGYALAFPILRMQERKGGGGCARMAKSVPTRGGPAPRPTRREGATHIRRSPHLDLIIPFCNTVGARSGRKGVALIFWEVLRRFRIEDGR